MATRAQLIAYIATHITDALNRQNTAAVVRAALEELSNSTFNLDEDELEISQVTNLATSLSGKADLVNGVVKSSQLPAITSYWGVMAKAGNDLQTIEQAIAAAMATASDATFAAVTGSPYDNANLKTALDGLTAAINTEAGKITSLQTLLGSNDVSLDTLQEVVTFIKANKSSLDTLGTNKLDKSVYEAFLLTNASNLANKADKADTGAKTAMKTSDKTTLVAGINEVWTNLTTSNNYAGTLGAAGTGYFQTWAIPFFEKVSISSFKPGLGGIASDFQFRLYKGATLFSTRATAGEINLDIAALTAIELNNGYSLEVLYQGATKANFKMKTILI